jgi:hypothetical protein
MFLRLIFGLLALVSLPTGALTGQKPEVPTDPWEVIHIAREAGEASVSRDRFRDPVIRAKSDGVDYEIGFYGCHLGRNCETVLFRAILLHEEWNGEHPEIDIIDDWNASKLFGRAILTESGQAILEHPVAMGPGMSRRTMRATFAAWANALDEFADHVDFK